MNEIEVGIDNSENTIDVEIKETGPQGPQGPQGVEGPQGEPGLSAYEIYLKNGGTLSEIEWLESLKGDTPSLSGYATEEYVNNVINNSITSVLEAEY